MYIFLCKIKMHSAPLPFFEGNNWKPQHLFISVVNITQRPEGRNVRPAMR